MPFLQFNQGKILNAAKKKVCEEFIIWIKSICNHLWWSYATCEGNEILLTEKWTSIVFYIQKKHSWTGNSPYHQCSHSELSNVDERCKNLLSPKPQNFEGLQPIVFNKTSLGDMTYLTQFSHTGVLEVFHSLLNKWTPKSTHFS